MNGVAEVSGTFLPSETATAVLDRRLASGEITPEEYRERKALLAEQPSGDHTPPARD